MTLELKNVTKRSGGETHIYDTSLTLGAGGFNVLLGNTLAGKTTLMRMMAGLEKPSSGEVWFKGKEVTGQSVQKRSAAMVYQQFINYPNFTVFENIASPLKVAGISKAEIRNRVERIADLLKLTPMLDRVPGELSGGQQQRTALARALVKQAELVLLDEPLANLDYKLREELREELPKLFKDSGAIVVYATTEPTEALLLAGNTVTLHEGKVTQVGRASSIYHAPENLISAKVFSDPPVNTTQVTKNGNQFVLHESVRWPVSDKYANLDDGRYTLAVRPHHVTLVKDEVRAEKLVPITGTVQVAEINGSESVVHARVLDESWVSQSLGIHDLEVGETTTMYLQTDKCFLYDQNDRLIEAR